jgi:hypothetical protein
MNNKEFEVNIKMLDDAVEYLVELNMKGGASLVHDWVLENIQHTISFLERTLRDTGGGLGSEQEYDDY